MTPSENYDHQLFLANSVWLAHVLRCLDKAGILDEETQRSIGAHLGYLGATAADLVHLDPGPEAEAATAHFDMLVRILPPGQRGGS